MKSTVLITGAGGFLGCHLLDKLDYSKYHTVYCLARKMESVRLPESAARNLSVKVIEGDLLNTESYAAILDNVDTVIHMAAATGKVNPEEYFNVNSYATNLLLDRCKKAGVKHFLFVSSIAVSFTNKYRYFYALSKEKAEGYVKSSGIRFTILRPTMIMGKGSPVFDGLASLAGLPVIPVFGDGDVEIQPIHVEDVARAITRIESESRYRDEVLELGGPEPVTIENFMKKVAGFKGNESPRVMHLPLSFIIFVLAILERLVYMLLPLTVGQLASFRNDGTAESNWLMKKLGPMMHGLDEIIRDSLEKDAQPEIPGPLMKECVTYCRYLSGQRPNAYVLSKYEKLHETIEFVPSGGADRLLLKLSHVSAYFTRMADTYSRFFFPRSIVRKKLAYLIAILEVTPPYSRYFDSADNSGVMMLLIKSGINGLKILHYLILSFILVFPVQLAGKLVGAITGKNKEQDVDNAETEEL